MEKIEDFSYSNLSYLIEGDENKASHLLDYLAKETEVLKIEISELNEKLLKLKDEKNQLFRASKDILKILKKDTPLAVQRGNYIVVVSDTSMSIENNVI